MYIQCHTNSDGLATIGLSIGHPRLSCQYCLAFAFASTVSLCVFDRMYSHVCYAYV